MSQADPTEATSDNWPAVVMASAAVTVVTLDLYGINVALPSMQRDVDASHTAASALVVSYSLSLTVLLLPIGRLADRLGRRSVLVAGLVAFGALSVACSAATTTAALLAARTAQGAAAAAISATSLSLVTLAVRRERRAFALALWTAITAAGATLGPPLAGVVVSEWSWRWFFAINGPLSLVFAAGALATVRESRASERVPPDRLGAVTFIVGLTLVIGAITVASAPGWPTALPAAVGVVGAAVLWWFVRSEHRAPVPLVDLSVLRERTYAATSVVAFGANWAYAALILYTPIYLQSSLGESAAFAGAMLLAFTVLYALWSPIVGRIEAPGRARAFVLVGLALIAVGLGLLALPDEETIWLVALALGISAIGQGLAFNTTGTIAMAAMGSDRAGVAAGLLSTIRQGGATVGLAVAGATYALVLSGGGSHDDAFNWVMATTAAVVGLCVLALPFLGHPERPDREPSAATSPEGTAGRC